MRYRQVGQDDPRDVRWQLAARRSARKRAGEIGGGERRVDVPEGLEETARVDLGASGRIEHGTLEHLQSHLPDLLCVFRRKRGFFSALWEKNTIRKSEFSARIPVLVLSVKKD